MPPLVTYASGQRCVVSPTECRLPCPPMSVLSRTFRGLEGPVARSELRGQWSAPRKVLQGVPFRVRFRPIFLAGFSGQQLTAYPKRRLVPLSPQFPEKRKGLLLLLEFSSSISTILPILPILPTAQCNKTFPEKLPTSWDQGGKLPRAGGCERFFESLQGQGPNPRKALPQNLEFRPQNLEA